MPPAHSLNVSESADSLPTVSDYGSYFEAQAQVATSLGMSQSITKQMSSGAYTYDQIETLLAQRRHVIDTIRRTKHPSTGSVPPTPKSTTQTAQASENIIASVGTATASGLPDRSITAPLIAAGEDAAAGRQAVNPSSSQQANRIANESPRKGADHNEVCTYQACHTCRPFFKERLAVNLEPALRDEIAAPTEQDVSSLPVHDAAMVCNLGLRLRLLPAPLRRSDESMDITMHHCDGNGYEPFGPNTGSNWTPTTTTSSETESDLSRTFDISPRPGPLSHSADEASEGRESDPRVDSANGGTYRGYTGEGGRLARGLGISGTDEDAGRASASTSSTPELTPSKGSSISLPNLPTTPLTGGVLPLSYSYSLPDRSSPASNKSSKSSRGSEVEVDCGVALTEEAVETGTPDISVENR